MTLVYRLLQWAVSVRFCKINAPSEIQGKCTDRLSASHFPPQNLYFWSTIYTFTRQHAAPWTRFKNHVQCLSRRCRCFFWKSGMSILLIFPVVAVAALPSSAFQRGLCCVTHAWVHLNAKLHKINKHCTAPTSLITNPCFFFLYINN